MSAGQGAAAATPGQAAYEARRDAFYEFLASLGYDNQGRFGHDEMELAFETGWQAAQAAVTAAAAAQGARQIGPCPDCGSPQPSMHPAAGDGGEVTRLCPNSFHAADPVPDAVARLFAAAAQPASGDDRASFERAALIDTLVKIRQACKHPEDVAGKTSGSQIVNGKYLAEHILRIIGALPHITEQPAPAAAPEPPFPAAQAALARVLSWFAGDGTRREAAATRAQLAHAYQDGGLPVPDELRRFL